MGQILKIVGLLAVSGFLFGGKVTDALYDRIEYSFDRLRGGDIRFDLRRGKLVALMNIRFTFKQSLGVNESLTGLNLSFSQQGIKIGVLELNKLVNLPDGETVDILLPLVIHAGPFFDRLQQIMKPGNMASAFAPLEISGAAYLASGITVPVHRTLNFLSVG